MVQHKRFVCDGRTCGTEIYSNADVKFYIACSYIEQHRRRGVNLAQRDALDASCLLIPKDAYIIDTTGKTPEESMQDIWVYKGEMMFDV